LRILPAEEGAAPLLSLLPGDGFAGHAQLTRAILGVLGALFASIRWPLSQPLR